MASPLFLVLVPAGVHAGMILSSLQRSIVIIIIIFIIIITIIIIIFTSCKDQRSVRGGEGRIMVG